MNYRWTLKDAKFTKDKGKVFSCFACGGGSTMGYKLAGYDVIGCNEIDKRMMEIYCKNHNPKYAFLESIQTFKDSEDLPDELYRLDILDGSPPCSTFSVAGDREKSWGKEKFFREGQEKQVLDTLFFDFIALAKKLQPKVVIAENVKGIMLGNAIKYCQRIYEEFNDNGYYCQHWLLNAKYMGVPQSRERVFFIGLRRDIADPFLGEDYLFDRRPQLDLSFNEEPILYGEFADGGGREIVSKMARFLWENRRYGDNSYVQATKRLLNKNGNFNRLYVYSNRVCPTLISKEDSLILFDSPQYLSKSEVCCISTFPQDYDFGNQSFHYVCGMSVPPIMMAKIALRVWEQWLSKI